MACALDDPETGETQAAVAEANILADAVCFARDLVNTPASHLTPVELARRVAEAAVEAGGPETTWLAAVFHINFLYDYEY